MTLLSDGWSEWTKQEALSRLDDDQAGISAAIRLVRLSGKLPLCVPEGLTDAHVKRLKLARLTDDSWALGLTGRDDESCLWAPVLMSDAGEVMLPADGTEEEMLTLHVAADADVFPHLLVLPRRVWIVERTLVPAIVLDTEEGVRFSRRDERGFSYIGLMLLGEDGLREVARYLWDPYELCFMGPAMDALPDPPGGKFRVNLAASERLEPIGGETPPPVEEQEEPPERPEAPIQPKRPKNWLTMRASPSVCRIMMCGTGRQPVSRHTAVAADPVLAVGHERVVAAARAATPAVAWRATKEEPDAA